ncbi:hypothetical protein UCRPA7_1075 [Phaeoacremonium minimum UCRPA7]|uniref:MARVEL domain-containing protein n=1 Tax=Phaeoacremonium minimum (strain UCR-PA7) TaxID=1286976 RepID=R8BVU8_PHAM7|nr:hypothetical protein UCRPA7_1075 [Phaeoacremonium minimum UCRPA7]EOO03414.1 hypothetical protein UCRPA7_1075 [Phaeoacremonium minimum UCRPA7]
MPLDTKRNFWTLKSEDGHSRSHIPPQPLWTFFIRIAQLVLAIIIVGLTGYATDTFGTTTALDGLAFSFFLFAWTLLFLGWLLISTFFFPIAYNYWAHVAAEGLTVVLWLAGWAVLAHNASDLAKAEKYLGSYSGYSDYLPNDVKSEINKTKRAIDCVKAAAGLGALEWLLFIVTLVFFGTSNTYNPE